MEVFVKKPKLLYDNAPPGYAKSYNITNFPSFAYLTIKNEKNESLMKIRIIHKDQKREVIVVLAPTNEKCDARCFTFLGKELVCVGSYNEYRQSGIV